MIPSRLELPPLSLFPQTAGFSPSNASEISLKRWVRVVSHLVRKSVLVNLQEILIREWESMVSLRNEAEADFEAHQLGSMGKSGLVQ